jgi:serine/threonine-protein kinase
MGSVWRAWDRREGRWVAAKLLARYDAASLQRFVREQRLRVRHRHVVQPTGWVEAADDARRVLFTMDLVRGGSVEQLLARHGPLPDPYVRVVLEQTLEALVAVHASGVVHRDIKPGNLLLEPTGTGRPWVRLGDFGVAALVGDTRLTRVPGGVGTGGYMAPEQAAGAGPDPRQDLYAAGVVARQLLTGRPPAESGPATGELDGLLDRLTDADPEARPPTAAAALAELRVLGVPTGAPWQRGPDPPDVVDLLGDPARPARARRRRVPPYAGAAGACFTVAAVVGGLLAWLVVR